MITSFEHKGLERFYKTGSKSGIQPAHAPKLSLILSLLDIAKSADDMNVPGFGLHPLKGDLRGYFSVKISGNWRLIFKPKGENMELIDYLDYH
jgi:proteic killer suppression protein